jgi:hypothetical protein
MKTNLSGFRRRLDALERAALARSDRGVWISPVEVEGVKAMLRRKLGLSPAVDGDPSAGLFWTKASSARTRETLMARFALLRERFPGIFALRNRTGNCEVSQ